MMNKHHLCHSLLHFCIEDLLAKNLLSEHHLIHRIMMKSDLKGGKKGATDNIVLVWGHLQADVPVGNPGENDIVV